MTSRIIPNNITSEPANKAQENQARTLFKALGLNDAKRFGRSFLNRLHSQRILEVLRSASLFNSPDRGPEASGIALKPYYQDRLVTIYHGAASDVLRQMGASSCDLAFFNYQIPTHRRWWQELLKPWLRRPEPIDTPPPEIFRVVRPGGLCLKLYGWLGDLALLSGWRVEHGKTVSVSVNVHAERLPPPPRSSEPPKGLTWHVPGHRIEWTLPLPASEQNAWKTPLGGILSCFSGPGSRILDPFCHDGEILIEARRCGRRAVGIEKSERLCEQAAKRLAGKL